LDYNRSKQLCIRSLPSRLRLTKSGLSSIKAVHMDFDK